MLFPYLNNCARLEGGRASRSTKVYIYISHQCYLICLDLKLIALIHTLASNYRNKGVPKKAYFLNHLFLVHLLSRRLVITRHSLEL